MNSTLRLGDLVNLPDLQNLADSFHAVTGMPLAIVETAGGSVLVASGWQEICTRFHRVNPGSLARCRESDAFICQSAKAGLPCEYHCRNGLNDIGLPVFVEGLHVATVFLGQFFYEDEQPDREAFREQARGFGFDEAQYLAALDRVPVFTRSRVVVNRDYVKRLADFLGSVAAANFRLRREIAEREQAERTLREQQAILRTTIDALPLFVARVDRNGRYLFVNRRYQETFGIPVEAFEGRHFTEVLPAVLCETHKPWIEECARGRPVSFVHENPPDCGIPGTHIEGSYTPVFAADGSLNGAVAAIADISARRKAEDALLLSEQRLRLHFEQGALGVIYWNVDRTVARWNPAAERIFGYAAAEAVGRHASFLLPPQAHAEAPAFLSPSQTVKPGELHACRNAAKDGRVVICAWHNNVLTTPDGQTIGMASLVEDITERTLAEDLLRLQRDLGSALASAGDLGTAIDCILDTTCQAPGIDCGGIYFIDEATGGLDVAAHRGVGPEFLAAVSHFDAASHQGRIAAGDKPRFLNFGKSPDATPITLSEGLRALVTIPIRHAGQSIAAAILASHTCDEFPAATCHALETMAGRLGEFLARFRAEAALADQEQRFALAVSSANLGTWDLDIATGRVAFNERSATMLGYRPEEIEPNIGFWRKSAHPNDWSRISKALCDHLEGRTPVYAVEYRVRTKAGGWCCVLDSGRVVARDASGNPTRAAGVHIDVTEWRHASVALRESEATLRAVTAAARDAIVMVDDTGRISFWNPAAERILGWTEAEASGKDLHQLIAPEEFHEMYRQGMLRFTETGKGAVHGRTLELRALRKDRCEIPVEISISGVRLGDRWHSVGILRDISDRRRAEAAIRESEAKYRRIFEHVQDVLYQTDAEGRITEISPSAQRYSRFTREELIGRHVEELYWDPADRVPLRAAIESAGEIVDYELRLRARDGGLIYASANARLVRDASGSPAGIEGTLRDVTPRKLAEEALREKTEELDRFFAMTPDMMCIADNQGCALRLNHAWARTFGHPLEEQLGRSILQFTHPDDMAAMQASCEGVIHGKDAIDFVSRFRCRDGAYRWVEWRATRYQDRLVFVVARDITERREAQAEMQKLYEQTRRDAQTRAELLREVNHRVKNNLTSILGLLLGEKQQALAHGQPAVGAVLDSLGQRLRGLLQVHQMLSASQWAPLRVSDLADRILRGALSALPADNQASLRIEPAPLLVSPRQAANLALVFNELATNTAKYAASSKAAVTVCFNASMEDGVMRLTYRDNGLGYPPEALDVARAGVGLSLVRQLVCETLRGSISLSNDGGAVAILRIRAEDTQRT